MSDYDHDPTLDDLRGRTPGELTIVITDLDVRLAELHSDSRGELRHLDDTEQARWDALNRVRDAAMARLRQHEAARVALGNPKAIERWGANLTGPQLYARAAAEVLALGADQARDQALRTLEARGRELGLPAAQGDQLDGLLRSTDAPGLDAAALARRVAVSESPDYRSAFAQLLTQAHPVLTGPEAEAVRAMQRLEAEESRAMGEVTPSAGGYGVPVMIDPSIMLSSGASVAPLLDIARVVPCNTSVWKGISSAPPVFSWDTEGGAVSDDSPTLAQPSISVYMMRGFIPYSFEVSQDYPDFANEMSQLLSAGYLDAIASATATGTGTGQPYGVITRLDATTTSEILVTTSGTIGAVDVFKAWNAVPERFRARASWLMSVSAESQIRSFSSANQSSAYFTVDLNADGLTRLNGRPTYVSDYAGSFVSGSTGHLNFAVVGDFSSYVVARRLGLQVEPVPMLFQQQTAGTGVGMPTGQRGAFAYARAGADVTVTNALRLLNQT
jgi:HK97 family phage major capsid protein